MHLNVESHHVFLNIYYIALVRGMFLCGEDFVDEAGGVMRNRFFLIPHVNILQL